MTVILVLLTFVAFLLIDHFYSRHKVVLQPSQQVARPRQLAAQWQAGVVGGFRVPEHLRYHPGHTWALNETPSLVRVGMDDFASKLTGKIDRIALPQRGQWIRQGQKLCTVHRDGHAVDMVSPIEGSVADINETLAQDPKLALRDPYGQGWLVTVQSPDAKTNCRNLLAGSLARWWMEESASRLQRKMPLAFGALAQDGGVAMDSMTCHLPDQEWTQIAQEFFLS